MGGAESFDACLERYSTPLRVAFVVFAIASLSSLGAGIVCVLRFGNSVGGCEEALLAGMCGSLFILVVVGVNCAFCVCGTYKGQPQRENLCIP
jgi:hypothetical protein